MNLTQPIVILSKDSQSDSIRAHLNSIIDDLLASFPPVKQLSESAQRGIIARYSSVLEGNFIYWMTGAYLSARSDTARAIIIDNLLEEVRDAHPLMLCKFYMAADAQPSEADALAVHLNLSKVRLFVGRLSSLPIITMMAFFEGFIQRFMVYLAELAERQGSSENQYTQVHGFCDIAHSQGLFNALELELGVVPDSRDVSESLYEGVYLLRKLIENIVISQPSVVAA